jgi:DNA-binding FrmR family transcriptional regulator
MAEKHLHAVHPAVVKRLKRASGHLQNVISMMEDQRPCLDIV